MDSLLKTLPYHSHEVIGAALCYFAIFLGVSPLLTTYLFHNLYSTLPRRTRVNWHVRVTSFIQATFICSCSIYVILTDESRVGTSATQRLQAYSPIAGRVQAFAAGYFLWDLFISVQHFRILGLGSLAHAVSALVITMMGFRPFANYYGINFVLYELSTPFLNIHWFMDKTGLTGTNWQRVNGVFLILSFFGCRIAWGWYQSVSLYRDIWTVWAMDGLDGDMGNEGQNASSKPDVLIAMLFLAANTILCFLNLYWFGLMVKAMRKRF